MPSVDAASEGDRDVLVQDRFDRMQCAYLKTLVSNDLIEEHRRQPLGHHSEPLERILMYFRRASTGRYALKRDSLRNTYRIITLSGVRGVAPRPVDGVEFETIEEAYHGIFLKQLKDMLRP